MKPIADLARISFFLLDMDGTFYLGDRLLPGAGAFMELLRTRGLDYLFLTNNSSRNRRAYAEKLEKMGIAVPAEKVFTSGEATAHYLRKRAPDAKLFLVGTPALHEEFKGFGFELSEADPDYVVLGFDTTLTYEKLWRLCDFVREGKPYIATHPDRNCPTENGFMPDAGAMMAFVEASTGRMPDQIIGKPYRWMIEAISEKVGVPLENLCMVGDRLYTDIALGEHGVTTILLLSGETRAEDLPASPHQPDYVMQDLQELVSTLNSLELNP